MSVFTNYKKQTLSIAKNDAEFMRVLEGKTIGEIGQHHQLSGDEFEFEEKEVNGRTIRNLYLELDGKTWQIPISRGFKWEERFNAEWLMNCEFYLRAQSMLVDGVAQTNPDGSPVLYDGLNGRALKEGLSLGNPSGITKGNNVERAFNVEEDIKRRANASLA